MMCLCTLLVAPVAEHEEVLWRQAQSGCTVGEGQEQGEGQAWAGCEVPSMEHTGAVPAAGATCLCLQGMSPSVPACLTTPG